MRRLKSAADRLGSESDRLFGVRSDGYFNLKQDYVGFGWLEREIGRAKSGRFNERTTGNRRTHRVLRGSRRRWLL